MSVGTSRPKFDRATVFQDLADILTEMTADWEQAFDRGITDDTLLIADLGFESIDVVQLVVAIEEHYQRRDLPLGELLMYEGRYVDDLRVGAIADFLSRQLSDA